jgi:hypothetical protein
VAQQQHPHRTSPDVPSRQPSAHRRWPYILLLIGVACISFVAGIAAGSAGQAGSSTAAVSAPAVLATFTGSGTETTTRFTVPRSGDWELRWSYSCASLGSRGNFIVDEDHDSDLNGVTVNELGNGGNGVARVHGDAGRHYLDVSSECDWSMSAVSQPSSSPAMVPPDRPRRFPAPPVVALAAIRPRHAASPDRLVLAVLAQELPELLDRLLLIRSEIPGNHQLRAVPVGPDITAGVIRAHQQGGMHDLYVVLDLFPRDPRGHKADGGRLAVVGRNVVEHWRPFRWQWLHHGSQVVREAIARTMPW